MYATCDINMEYKYHRVIAPCGNIYIHKWQMAEKVHTLKMHT